MTDAPLPLADATAEIIIDTLDRDYTKRDGTWTSRHEAIQYITRALAQARRETWEAAAKVAQDMPTFGGEQKRLMATMVQVCRQQAQEKP